MSDEVRVGATNRITVVKRIVCSEVFRQVTVSEFRHVFLIVVVMLVGQIDIGNQIIVLAVMCTHRPNTIGYLDFFLTSSSCHPKFFVKEFSYFLMPCHQHCLGINLLVQR